MIGQKLILLHETDSTNNYAAKLLTEGKLAHGTVILADKQTAGRGQRGNSWSSMAGNQLAYTVYAETAFLSAERYWFLNLAVALAVQQTIFSLIPEQQVRIKWPNDILVNNRKISGILIETQWRSSQIQGAIIGVGVNIQPEPGLAASCSLRDFSEKDTRTMELAHLLSQQLELQFQRLRNGEWNAMLADYHCQLWMKDAELHAELADQRLVSGFIRGIDGTGNLLFETEGGVQSFGLKEIVFSY